jgi:hypothetical protein
MSKRIASCSCGQLTAAAADEPIRIGDEGSKATFSFCPACGATVYYQTEGNEESIAIPVGAFAEPGFPEPTVSVYEERKHAWVAMPENIEHLR